MKTARRPDRRLKADKPNAATRRMPVWLPAATLALILAGVAVGVWAMNRPSVGAGAPAPSGAPGASSGIPAEVRQRLVGRWLRPDGGYVLSIKSVGEDGKVDAVYNNPRPIHVAKAQVAQEAGKTSLFVELRDTGYPGSFYTLVFDTAQDQFVGVYHHLGLNQDFDVNFVRLPKEAAGTE